MILEQYLRRRLSAPARENRESDDGCGGATHAGGHARCKAGRHGPTDDNSTLLSARSPHRRPTGFASKANHVGNRLQPPFQRASRNTHFYLTSDTPRTLSNSTTSFRSPSRFLLNPLFIVITIIIILISQLCLIIHLLNNNNNPPLLILPTYPAS